MPVALITGASRGIGQATAVAAARANFAVALVARSEPDLQTTARLCRQAAPHSTPLPIPTDLTDPAACRQAVAQTVAHFGRLDALVHCAGLAPVRSIEQTTDAEWRATLDTNLSAAFHLAQAAWPHLKRPRRDAANDQTPNPKTQTQGVNDPGPLTTDHGQQTTDNGPRTTDQEQRTKNQEQGTTIVLISSLASRDPFPGFAAYAAAKAGLNLLGLSLAREGLPHQIRVHTIAPGAVETDMFRAILTKDQYPPDKTLTPDEVADTILHCLTGPLRHTTGEVLYLHKSL